MLRRLTCSSSRRSFASLASSSTPSQSKIIPSNETQIAVVQPSEEPPSATWDFPLHIQDNFPKPGAKRPHLNIPVNPNHGLWHFFRLLRFEQNTDSEDDVQRRRLDDKEEAHNFVWRRIAHEDKDSLRSISGRPWTAAELRRKSFQDLHALWYIVLRERNLLATQIKEARRATYADNYFQLMKERARKCKRTHACIKLVLSERRRGYERAISSLPKGLASWRKARWGNTATSTSTPEESKSATETQPLP